MLWDPQNSMKILKDHSPPLNMWLKANLTNNPNSHIINNSITNKEVILHINWTKNTYRMLATLQLSCQILAGSCCQTLLSKNTGLWMNQQEWKYTWQVRFLLPWKLKPTLSTLYRCIHICTHVVKWLWFL